ncbi:hypothetical protein C8J55DRAFT_567271 [Lentinula edodes]|uniref:Uncharacterized protein n=1 Tax=Lentinula lateritia TaxID=40482 RepID=A0A9W8ZQ42_9AGAR|nr:hypothetical protein C8J55DRAFT_567271 [Lentinula edodes]
MRGTERTKQPKPTRTQPRNPTHKTTQQTQLNPTHKTTQQTQLNQTQPKLKEETLTLSVTSTFSNPCTPSMGRRPATVFTLPVGWLNTQSFLAYAYAFAYPPPTTERVWSQREVLMLRVASRRTLPEIGAEESLAEERDGDEGTPTVFPNLRQLLL